MGNLRTLLRLAWREAWRRPLQSLFFVVGVSIGVAMIIAIDLANSSANRAFTISTDAVVGKATHQIVRGPNGVEESVYVQIRRELGYRKSAPIVEGYVRVKTLNGQPMRLLGVDSFAERPFREELGTAKIAGLNQRSFSAFMAEPNTVLIGANVSDEYRLPIGESLEIQVGSYHHKLRIVDVIASENRRIRRSLKDLMVTDIATAQEIFAKIGKLDRIDLILPDAPLHTTALERIESILPPGARIESSDARRGAVIEMTKAFRLNLTALSLLALVVGLFLIYNTVSFSVIQRRAVIGRLRAIGMTRSEIFAMILAQATVLGIAGALLGIGLGIFLSRSAIGMVTTSINDLFFVSNVREIDVSALTLLKGGLLGIAAAMTGALIPAYEATRVSPAGTLQRSTIESRTRGSLHRISIAGVAALVLGAVLLLPDWHLGLTFLGVLAVLVGMALLTPSFMRGFAALAGTRWLRRRLPILGNMAIRDIDRALSRTSTAVAALMIAVSVIVGVSVMVGSFRMTVERWLTDLLGADIFVSPPAVANSQMAARLDPDAVKLFGTFPGIAQVATARSVEIDTKAMGRITLSAITWDIAGEKRHYKSAVGNHAETWDAFRSGGLIVNEPLASRYKRSLGDKITLLTDRGEVPFKIVGVVYDFDVRPGAMMYDAVYRNYWDDAHVSSAALFVQPGVNVDEKIGSLKSVLAGKLDLIIRSNRALRADALAVFDRTFSIFVALQMLAAVVAFIGILSALMSLQLERTREIGTLRSIGITRGQLSRLTLLETGLMGAIAGLIAMPTGLVLAAILIYIINLRSFGWTLQMQLQPSQFTLAFVVALVSAFLAGIYPAWRMGQMQPAEALRTE